MSTDNKPNEIPVKMLKINIDGIDMEVAAGTNMVLAAHEAKKDIPHFCYHPGMSIAGQCRMCYVEIEGMPKLATACSTPIAEGMKIKTEATSEKVRDAQKNTLEFTLLHHPLDCPICDRGGECKLQDYTLDYGPPRSRMDDEKRHSKKHTPVSEQIVLDQERCIVCTRCVRFSNEVDGRMELVVTGRGSENKIDICEGHPMSGPFTGNVVDLCPVGALTAKDFRFKARPWELLSHDAICTGCAVGCSVTINTKHRHPGIPRPDGTRPNPKIERLMPRENSKVNTWWMCDKGRWGYHFNNNDSTRLEQPLMKSANVSTPSVVSLSEAQKALETINSWEFLVDDSAPHELLEWGEQLRQSWTQRGRQVSDWNQTELGSAFVSFWNPRKNNAWNSSPADWSGIKTVVATQSYRELESQAAILSLRLGQNVRAGTLNWHTRTTDKLFQNDDLNSTAFLVPAPKSKEDIASLAKLPADSKFLILWSEANARGLLNKGIVPMELTAYGLGSNPQKNPQTGIFLLSQSTQNPKASGLVGYAQKCSHLVMTDSFKSILSDSALLVLPLNPLYESQCSFTNLEGRTQESKGVNIHHPNVPAIERGGTVVSAALKTATF